MVEAARYANDKRSLLPMIAGLFWPCIRSLLTLLHTLGLPMKGFPGVSTIQLPVDLIPDAIRAKVVADVERAGGAKNGMSATSSGGRAGGGVRGRGRGGGSVNVATGAAWARPAR